MFKPRVAQLLLLMSIIIKKAGWVSQTHSIRYTESSSFCIHENNTKLSDSKYIYIFNELNMKEYTSGQFLPQKHVFNFKWSTLAS